MHCELSAVSRWRCLQCGEHPSRLRADGDGDVLSRGAAICAQRKTPTVTWGTLRTRMGYSEYSHGAL
jgi:hypothetical protein